MLVGMHRITLHPGVAAEEFERFMADEVFPAAGLGEPVNRGGRSGVKSHHLLRVDGEYLWLIKGSGIIGTPDVTLDEALQGKLEGFGTRESAMATVIESFEVGPRDTSGNSTGDPRRGTDL